MPESLYTIGEIVRRLNEATHRVDYAIRTRGIAPAAVAGRARVWRASDIPRIVEALQAIDRAKEAAPGREGCA
jgi:hypothetical protein